jgi:DNA processing protein
MARALKSAPQPKAEPAAVAPRRARLSAAEAPAELYSAEERATLAFFSVEGIGPATMKMLRVEFGSLAAALKAPKSRVLPFLRDIATRTRFARVDEPGTLADRILERAQKVGARLLFPGRPGWPRQLDNLPFPPVLYLRGKLDPTQRRVALVGSREADPYGLELSAFFAAGLAQASVSVVSGGAKGVDSIAHRAALGNGGSTVVVLGTGIDVAYPEENAGLFHQIVEKGGALVSHLPPGSPGVPQNFVVRNRVIAALSDAVVVTRAGLQSGALGTAAAAQALGRPVFAVPGDVSCDKAAGVNQLIEAGQARAITGLAPLAKELGLPGKEWPSAAPLSPDGGGRRPKSRSAAARASAPIKRAPERPQVRSLPEDLRSVYQALSKGPKQFDDLLAEGSLDAAGLANALLRLEVIGLCEERDGKVFARI